MKKKIAALLLALALAVTATGCQGAPVPESSTPSTSTTEPSDTTEQTSAASTVGRTDEDGELDENQYLNVLLADEPTVLDVARFSMIQDRNVFYNVLEPLTRIEDGIVTPAGAESWDVSDDGLVYTFHLRENYWSDGQQVTAQDYAGALIRQATPANTFAFSSDYSAIVNFSQAVTGEVDPSEIGVKVIDDSTLEITLSQPSPSLLSTVDFFPQRQDYVDEYGDTLGANAESVISCGPFVLTDWVHNSQLTFEKNDQYWDAENVKLQSFHYLIMNDTTAQLSSLENGSLDYLNVSDADYIDKFREGGKLVEEPYSAARTVMLVFNCQDEIFQNQKIRQAFSLSIDRESYSEILQNGLTTPAYGLIPEESSVGQLHYRDYAPEPLLALQEANPDPKALLIEGMQELGLGDDPSALTVTLSMGGTNAKTKSIGEFYQQMWQSALGVVIELEFNDSATHMSNMNSGNFQMGLTSWGANVEPLFQLSRWSSESGGQSKWVNEEYQQLVNEASSTVDDQARLELYAQAEEMLITEAAIAPICYNGSLLFSYPYVHGLDNNPFDTVGMQKLYTIGRNQ